MISMHRRTYEAEDASWVALEDRILGYRKSERKLRELKRALDAESSEPTDVLSDVARHLAESVSEHVGPVGTGLKDAQYSFETRDDALNNTITITVNVTHSDD